jgi:hypothetical protein
VGGERFSHGCSLTIADELGDWNIKTLAAPSSHKFCKL